MRSLDPSYIKDTMSNNGEFIARLDSAFRYKLTQMAVLEKCVSSANSIPDKFLPNILEPLSTVKYDRVVTTDISLLELRLGIDPQGDYSVLKHMGRELDEWIEMFYAPCYGALYGMNVGTTPEVEVSYLMAFPWHSHRECMRLSCIGNNMRWDRSTGDGGCIPGLNMGSDAQDYGTDAADATNCAKDVDENDGAAEVCKYDQTELNGYQTDMQACWADPLPVSNVDYYLTNYCLPDVTIEQKTLSTDIMTRYNSCRGNPDPTDHSNIGRRRLQDKKKEYRHTGRAIKRPSVKRRTSRKDTGSATGGSGGVDMMVPVSTPKSSDESQYRESLRAKIEANL